MSKSTSSHSGKGRIVTPATPTAKAAGIPARKKAPAKKAPAKKAPAKKAPAKKATAPAPIRRTAKGHAQVIADMRVVAMKASHKPPYATPALDEALAKADTLAGKGHTLTTAIDPNTGKPLYKGTGNMPATARDGLARREWCARVKAPKVSVLDIMHDNKVKRDGASRSERSENTVRQRVITRGKYLTGARYYAVRSEAVTGSVDDQPMVYIVRV